MLDCTDGILLRRWRGGVQQQKGGDAEAPPASKSPELKLRPTFAPEPKLRPTFAPEPKLRPTSAPEPKLRPTSAPELKLRPTSDERPSSLRLLRGPFLFDLVPRVETVSAGTFRRRPSVPELVVNSSKRMVAPCPLEAPCCRKPLAIPARRTTSACSSPRTTPPGKDHGIAPNSPHGACIS